MQLVLYLVSAPAFLLGLLFLIGSGGQLHRFVIAAIFLAISGACIGLALRLRKKASVTADPKLWIRRCKHCGWEAPLSSNTATCDRCGAPIKLERASAGDSVNLDED